LSDAADLPIGRAFDCRFGAFAPRLEFLSATQLQLDVPGAGGVTRQVVNTEVTRISAGAYMLSWIEADGTTVVHVQDFNNGVVFSHARLPDGSLLRVRGPIEWVADGANPV